jgi:hypothetical protein
MDKKLSDPRNSNSNGWIEFWAGFCCLVGSTWVFFVFATTAGKIKTIHRNAVKSFILSLAKYTFATLAAAILFTLIGIHGVALHNVKLAIDAYYLADAQRHGELANYYVRIELYIALGLLALIITAFSSFIIFIFSQIGFVADKSSYKAAFLERVYYLIGTTISVCLFMALQFVYIFTISHDTGAYWTNDEFESNTAGIWCQFFGAFFQFFWVLFTVLAILVVKDKSVGESYESDNSGRSSSSSRGSTTSRTDYSTTSMNVVASTNDTDY